ncbi:MAG: hypothetical protein ACOC3Z_03055 [Nanoarchaeota archaeon]
MNKENFENKIDNLIKMTENKIDELKKVRKLLKKQKNEIFKKEYIK